MRTVEDVARGATASLNSDASWQLVAQWVSSRYQQICRRVRMRHLRDVGELFIPAPITAGTVTVTEVNASDTGDFSAARTITGDSTAIAAWGPFVVGRHIKVQTTWYLIVAFENDSLILESPYSEPSGTSKAYHLVQRYTPLIPGLRHLGKFVHHRRKSPVILKTLEEMDELAPSRQQIGTPPRIVAEIGQGVDKDGKEVRLVECYPYSNQQEVIHYMFWKEAPALDISDNLPLGFDEDALREGVLVDLMRYEMARAVRAGNAEAAALWRNDYRAQATVWERYIMEQIREDKGADDATFLLEDPGFAMRENTIISAHDYVLLNWPR